MSELNTSVWGTGIELNAYTDKLDENKVYYATTSDKPTGEGETNNKSQKYTLDRLDADGKITCGKDLDLTPCYVMVDANCPWTKSVSYQFIRENNTNSSKKLDVGIINENKAVPVMLGTGYTRPASNTNYVVNCSTSNSSFSPSVPMPYYMFNGWKNNRRVTNSRVENYHTLPSVNGANFQPFVKFGGKSIIARIMVRAKSGTTSYQDYSLHDYCYKDNIYTDKNIVLCVYYTAYIINSSGNNWETKNGGGWSSTYSGAPITAVPFTSDYTFDINGSFDVTASTWDMYLNDQNSPCLFGNFTTTISLNTNATYFNAVDTHSSFEQGTTYPNVLTPNTQNSAWGTADEFYEYFLKSAAYLGLFFTPYSANDLPFTTTNQDELFTDEKMYCGIIDENGITHGEYTHGTDNTDQIQYTSKDLQKDSNVKTGGGGSDPNNYRNTSGFNSVLNAPRDFNKRYILSDMDIRTLNTDFFGALSGVATADVVNTSLKTFYTNNPVDCIVSLKWFPFNLPQYGSASLINLGAYATTVSAYQYVGSGVEVYNLGECEIFPHFGVTVFGGDKPCFLDYEPYTHIECIVPYCGTVRLNPSDVMGKTVKIMMTIDVYTGACVAYIMCDGLTIDTIAGTISVNLPISGVATADLDAQIHTATMNYKSAKIQEATTVISSALKIATSVNPSSSLASNVAASGGTISNVVQTVANATQNLRETQYDLEHINVPFKSVGTNSALNGAKAEQFCSINITRPILHGNTITGAFDVDKFAHTNGYACLCNGKISDFTGYTQISDVDLSGINATNEEKAIIMNLLKGGVYI